MARSCKRKLSGMAACAGALLLLPGAAYAQRTLGPSLRARETGPAASVPSADPAPLTLRVNDVAAEPGSVAKVVLRTYESRPIGQGQVCLRVSGAPLLSAEAITVNSSAGDALATLEAVDAGTFLATFSSGSASINELDGPMVILDFRLPANAVVGSTFAVEVDPVLTELIDATGADVLLDLVPGDLTVRAVGDPYNLEMGNTKVDPGAMAPLEVGVSSTFDVTSGQVAISYDTGVASGPAVVTMGPEFVYSVDETIPGLVVVSFSVPAGPAMFLPGTFATVDVQTLAGVAPGTGTTLLLDPALTYLQAADGSTYSLDLSSGLLEFR